MHIAICRRILEILLSKYPERLGLYDFYPKGWHGASESEFNENMQKLNEAACKLRSLGFVSFKEDRSYAPPRAAQIALSDTGMKQALHGFSSPELSYRIYSLNALDKAFPASLAYYELFDDRLRDSEEKDGKVTFTEPYHSFNREMMLLYKEGYIDGDLEENPDEVRSACITAKGINFVKNGFNEPVKTTSVNVSGGKLEIALDAESISALRSIMLDALGKSALPAKEKTTLRLALEKAPEAAVQSAVDSLIRAGISKAPELLQSIFKAFL